MVVQSIIIGVVFGVLWSLSFTGRYKKLSGNKFSSPPPKTYAWFLARTSSIRYLLLAVLLGILILKYKLIIVWWFLGFIVSFWTVLVMTTRK
jgi:hypothetical protein